MKIIKNGYKSQVRPSSEIKKQRINFKRTIYKMDHSKPRKRSRKRGGAFKIWKYRSFCTYKYKVFTWTHGSLLGRFFIFLIQLFTGIDDKIGEISYKAAVEKYGEKEDIEDLNIDCPSNCIRCKQ
jgi:hypothetical protein